MSLWEFNMVATGYKRANSSDEETTKAPSEDEFFAQLNSMGLTVE